MRALAAVFQPVNGNDQCEWTCALLAARFDCCEPKRSGLTQKKFYLLMATEVNHKTPIPLL